MKPIILTGDCIAQMKTLEPGTVQTCVTSPPYFGLRDYGHDGQIGLEQTPDEFVGKLVEVFREVRRVLKDDGTLWLNLGDTYASNGGAHGGREDNQRGVGAKRTHEAGGGDQSPRRAPEGLKQKDLIGIPWRVAFALQADGWYLRQDIIWAKPNPMPESVKDRCTKAHEYIFLLTKSPRYFFDSDAIQEPANPENHRATAGIRRTPPGQTAHGGPKSGGRSYVTRNRRSVWTVPVKPYKGAHFATFPPELIEPCILAASRPGDLVLDPFGGSGTTGAVAMEHRRTPILIELNPAYHQLIEARLNSVEPRLLNQ